MKKFLTILLLGFTLAGCSLLPQSPSATRIKLNSPEISIITPSPEITNQNTPTPMAQNITAIIHTSKGDMKVKLFSEKAPNTVANFVGLATGTKDWTDPKTGQKVSGKPLYQNLIFHRVIKDFMIQGGDPLGDGTGGPGYIVPQEIGLPHLRGSIATARTSDYVNPKKDSSGSQFYIAQRDLPGLDGQYTVFGGIDASDSASLAVLDSIASVKTDANDKPLEDVVIKNIDIVENK